MLDVSTAFDLIKSIEVFTNDLVLLFLKDCEYRELYESNKIPKKKDLTIFELKFYYSNGSNIRNNHFVFHRKV